MSATVFTSCHKCGGTGAVETVGMAHAPGCFGDCDRHGCPVPVPELDQCGDCYATGELTACCGLPKGYEPQHLDDCPSLDGGS